ncbi:hypothetical protein PRIPAC_96718, partial [Pristionchus pacificus]|uniref:Uncharacterized protein n=1 Tax=Pristionchus pacificus TaxID=54126 RepID=A0A2A6B3A9_PRIPA
MLSRGGKNEEGWDEMIMRKVSLLDDTVVEGNEFQRLIVRDATVVWELEVLKREEIRAQERIVEQLKRGVDEDLPDGLLARVIQAETAMKSALQEMRWKVESFKKEVVDLPEQLASQLAVVKKNIATLTKMERSLTPLIREETRYRNPQRLPRDGKFA